MQLLEAVAADSGFRDGDYGKCCLLWRRVCQERLQPAHAYYLLLAYDSWPGYASAVQIIPVL